MLLEDVVSLLHLLDFQFNAKRCRLDSIYRVHDNLEVCQLLNVPIQVEPKSLYNVEVEKKEKEGIILKGITRPCVVINELILFQWSENIYDGREHLKKAT